MNWQHFFNMGGFADYVWPSFIVVLLSLSICFSAAYKRHQTQLKKLRKKDESVL